MSWDLVRAFPEMDWEMVLHVKFGEELGIMEQFEKIDEEE
jgi:hypothetical protein